MDLVIDFAAPGFSVANAVAMARLAEAAYLPTPEAFALTYGNLQDVRLVSQAGTQCFVGHTDRLVFAAYRGTFEEVEDFLNDVDFGQVKGFGGHVHLGDLRAFEEAWVPVRDMVISQMAPGRLLCITGHSLGGALTALAGRRFHDVGIVPAQVYTFGAPRVGNRGFAKRYPVPLFRVVNKRDIIPHLPPEESGLTRLWHMFVGIIKGLGPIDYTHVGQLEWIGFDGQIVSNLTDDDVFINGLAQAITLQSTNAVEEVADHAVGDYIRGLEARLG